MLPLDQLLQTRLIPPRPHRLVLARPRVLEQLREAIDYRLTIVQAGTGYGKTTALAALQGAGAPLFWYTLDESDRDPQQFLAYLIAAFRNHMQERAAAPLALLRELGMGSAVAPAQVIDTLINALSDTLQEPAFLILDDYHTVASVPEIHALVERFLSFLPADLHVVLSTWQPVNFSNLPAWRRRGEVLEIGRAELAFRLEEIADLFQENYGMGLAGDEISLLHDKTEGWPIVLQLIWQGIRSGASAYVRQVLAGGAGSSATLFDQLAHELLDRQPPEIADFLRETAILNELSPGACAAVRGQSNLAASAALLKQLHALDLFVFALGDEQYRYHHLFHDFLRAQGMADLDATRARHARAAAYFHSVHANDEAIGHWLAAEQHDEAAAAIASIGETVVQAGRLNRLAAWIDALPPQTLAEHPRLLALLGDIYRLRSLFDGALAWYAQAEKVWRAREDIAGISRALRGQALVYLDTVRAAQAETLLQEALRLTDGTPDREARARLLVLMAENKLNLGKPAEAETLRGEADMLRNESPGEDTLDARVKLRTGRLREARHALEAIAAAEERAASAVPQAPIGPPRAHRETVLLLSLVEAFLGQSIRAFTLAQDGIALGERLESPFITAVGYMRLGHALQLGAGPAFASANRTEDAAQAAPKPGRDGYAAAASWYRAAIALGDRLAVRRTRAEAMWGLTRTYGYSGDLEMAASAAAEASEIATESGDVWLMALANLALGASHVLAGNSEEALRILGTVLNAFRECQDMCGRAATRMWMALAWLESAGKAGGTVEPAASSHFLTSAQEMLALCETYGYDFLFTGNSLLGPPDARRLVPVLLEARTYNIRPAYVARLLAALGMPGIKVHPGYQLRIQTLGAFRVWRGEEEIQPREWQRDKARQLFQLLLAERSPIGGALVNDARHASSANLHGMQQGNTRSKSDLPNTRLEQGSGNWLQRGQIVERLWPQLAPDAAIRDFKVALNALVRALEPAPAPANANATVAASARAFFFIERDGTAYRLRPEADLWLDAAEFEAHCRRGLHGALDDDAIAALRAALALYAGDYLPDALYEDWTTEARDRLLTLYLRSADRLASALIERGQVEEGLDICQAMLARDNCWEHAYQLMMTAYARQGNRAQAHRVYMRCVETLRQELDVAPSEETLALYAQISG